MNTSRLKTLVLFTYGACNLNCRYCTIDKNPALKDVDDYLKLSFLRDDYFDRILEYFPANQLERIEAWGGEPSLGLDRIYPLLDKIIKHYPNFNLFFFSTNFAYEGWVEKVLDFANFFSRFPLRKFTIEIQLSCDGPEYINDASRGLNTTKNCLKNYNKLLDILKNTDALPSNVYINFFPKQTLDLETIRLLQDEKTVYEYYKFFEDNFYEPAMNIKNVAFFNGVPNTAVPSPVTKEDGEKFANFCRICSDINKSKKMKYYDNVLPFKKHEPICPLSNTYAGGSFGCGTAEENISLLPDNLFCICHLGFMEIVEKYKQYRLNLAQDKNKVISFNNFLNETKFKRCLTKEEYDKFSEAISYGTDQDSFNRIANMQNIIQLLGEANQIDSKYANPKQALLAAHQMTELTAYCINDSLITSNTITLTQNGIYKQLLNGAVDIITEGE